MTTPPVPTTPTLPGRRPAVPHDPVSGGIGESVRRPDGTLKVTGEFAYSSDLWMDGMLWGATVRSPHPRARIRSIDIAPALATTGVHAVLTADDVPGRKTYGLEIADQPVLAWDQVRYQGEPVALVAADHPETARRAAARVRVDYQRLDPVTDPELALSGDAPHLHEGGNLLRHVPIRHGDPAAGAAAAAVTVSGTYELGMQDQAFLGPESGLAVPDGQGGVDLYVATQWLHVDQEQLAACLGLPAGMARLTLAGVGGAFGAREDLSMQVHACMLALHTGRPVKMLYSREESFFGHVHRHPARLEYTHGATADGRLVYVKARILLDGGAYASSSTAVCANAACFAAGPYEVPNAEIDAYVVYTNNPPCGAMRGFGSVQTCFAHESQMDRLAAELGMSPVALRMANAMREGSALPTGQRVTGAAPVADLLRRVEAVPLPPPDPAVVAVGAAAAAGATADGDAASPHPLAFDLRTLPGGLANVTHGEGVRRGVGYAVGFKNIGFSEGFDDYATARVRLALAGGEPVVEVHTAAAEVGQGLVTIQAQIARTELGVARVVVLPADTRVGSAGSSSASRQTWMTGGAVKAACEEVRAAVLRLAATRLEAGRLAHPDPVRGAADASSRGQLTMTGDGVVDPATGARVSLAELLDGEAIEVTHTYRHRPTSPLDRVTGQGDAHVAYAFAAHRAVVDVDVELGLVRVVEIATAQDVGKALNPQAVEGQIEGGIAQGLGLALMEEIQVSGGEVRNASFTDYLIPTLLDMPPVKVDVLELAHPDAPYGVRGVGEAPTISSTPAIVAAVRAATGRPLTRVPIRPEHITGTDAHAGQAT
jgi:xanthine dehydrogenase D subunit